MLNDFVNFLRLHKDLFIGAPYGVAGTIIFTMFFSWLAIGFFYERQIETLKSSIANQEILIKGASTTEDNQRTIRGLRLTLKEANKKIRLKSACDTIDIPNEVLRYSDTKDFIKKMSDAVDENNKVNPREWKSISEDAEITRKRLEQCQDIINRVWLPGGFE